MGKTAILAGLSALALAIPAAAQDALVGATLIDGSGNAAIEDGVVVTHEGRIACAGSREACPIVEGWNVRDVSGSFITPGLIDAHVHFGQTGWLDGRPDGLRDPETLPYAETIQALRADPGRWHRSYLCSGVTAVFDVGGAPWTVTGEHRDAEGRTDRVHTRAAGPLITHAHALNEMFAYGPIADQPTFLPMENEPQVRDDVARLKAMGSDAVKVWFVAPTTPGDAERLNALMMVAGEAARAAGLPLIVHATELEAAKTALRAGAAMLVHSVEDAPVDDEFIALLRANDAVYAPTLNVGRNWTRAMLSAATGEAAAVQDENHCVDERLMALIADPGVATQAVLARSGGRVTPFAAYFETIGRDSQTMAANLRVVRDAGGRIVLATDAGNPLTLHGPSVHDEMEAMQAAGMTPPEIIRAATSQGAHALGMDDAIGSLRAGMVADLLVLAENPTDDVSAFRSITHVMRAGKLSTQQELQVR